MRTFDIPSPVVDDASELIWFFGELMLVRMSGEQTGGELAVVEHVCRRGQAPPWHRHLRNDETFHVLEGRVTVWCGDPTSPILRGGPGDTAFLPRGVPHAFRVDSEAARFLGMGTPPGHEQFYRDGGRRGLDRTLPPLESPDMDALNAACEKHGVEILGPPPALGVDHVM